MKELEELHGFMKKRLLALRNELDRDKGGGLADSKPKHDEVKFWKEYIERNFLPHLKDKK